MATSQKHTVYLDHAATTPVDDRVLKAMLPFFKNHFGNPSSLYSEGLFADRAIQEARKRVATILGTQPDTILFTGSGTESDNLAIVGMGEAAQKHGKHIIITAIEHHAVLESAKVLKSRGFDVTLLPVDSNGRIHPLDISKALRNDTVLVSVMYANNEIGTIMPIADIGREILKYRKNNNTHFPYFHTDACQAPEYLEINVEKLHVDALTLNGGKIYGPKGSGLLYIRRNVPLLPQLVGGTQEFAKRAGTENVPSIIGFAKALEIAQRGRAKEVKRIESLAAYFYNRLIRSGVVAHDGSLNGPQIGETRLANNLNIEFKDADAEALLIYLDSFGVSCSTGSACTAQNIEPSHVLAAIGLSAERIKSSLRFTLGRTTSKKDIDFVVTAVSQALKLVKRSYTKPKNLL